MKIQQYNESDSPQVGVVDGEPNDIYHAQDCVSNSKLSLFCNRPKLYEAKYITGTVKEERKHCFEFGNAFDTYLLERENFDKLFYSPSIEDGQETRKSTKAGKAYWGEVELIAGSRIIITQEDMKLIETMAESVMACPIASQMLVEANRSQLTFRTPKLANGLQAQCRTDAISLDSQNGFIVDIKTINSLDDIEGHFAKFQYYRQCGFYQNVIKTVIPDFKINGFYFIFVEKSQPHEVAVIKCQDSMVQQGQLEIKRDLTMLAESLKTGEFPSFLTMKKARKFGDCNKAQLTQVDDEGIGIIDLPSWYYVKCGM